MKTTTKLLQFLACSAFLASASTGFAQNTVYRWIGGSSVWTTAGNWAVESGTGSTPPPTGGTIAARINVGATGNLNPTNAMVYAAAQGETRFNPTDNRVLVIANGASTATVTISGGIFDSRNTGTAAATNSDAMANGNASAVATLNITGGTYTNVNGGARRLNVGLNGGTATVNISAGNLISGFITFGNHAGSVTLATTSTVNISGTGVLETGGFTRESSTTPAGISNITSNITFNGGTLRARDANNADFMADAAISGTALVKVGGVTIDSNGFNIGISQALTQDAGSTGGGLTKSGAGTLTLSGANTYTGATSINAGTLSASNIVVSGGNSHLGNATSAVTLGSAGAQGTLSYTGNSATYARGLTIGGAGGGRFDVATSGQTVTMTTAGVAGTGLFTVGGAGNTTINTALSHTGGLTKADAGILTLAGSNTYTGATTITGGSLALSGSGSIASSSAITINSSTSLSVTGLTGNFTLGASQSLGGSGTLTATGKTVIASGTLTPGNSPGTLTQDGGTLQLGVGGDLNWQVYDANGPAGIGGFDTVSLINGATLDLSALSVGNTYNINLWSLSGIGPDANGNAINFNNSLNYAWTLFSTGTAINDFDTSKFTINTGAFNGTSGFSNTLNGSFQMALSGDSTDLVLTYTAVPEPGAALLGGLGLLVLLRRRRN